MVSTVSYNKNYGLLRVFQNAIGINSAARDFESSARVATNKGIHKEIVATEKWRRIEYYASSIIINTCVLLQIILATVPTASGTASSPLSTDHRHRRFQHRACGNSGAQEGGRAIESLTSEVARNAESEDVYRGARVSDRGRPLST